MPNWCEGSLSVVGEDASSFFDDLRDKVAQYKKVTTSEDRDIPFLNFFVPMPQEFQKVVKTRSLFSAIPHAKAARFEEERLQHLYGASSWYDWSVKNWSVQWDVSEFHMNYEERWCSFSTTWGPPENAIMAASQRYPDTTFRLAFCEMGLGFAGYLDILNGQRAGFYNFAGEWNQETVNNQHGIYHPDLIKFLTTHHLKSAGG